MNRETDTIETINKSYYYRLALRCIFILIAGAILTGVFLYFSLYREPGSSYAESYSIISALRAELFYKSTYLYITTLLFIIIGITIICLLYSHRVAGPIYRLGVFARKVASGDLTEAVTLRQKDAIYPIAEDLNGIIAMYREIIEQLETKMKEVREMSSLADQPAGTAERDMIEKISKRVYEMNGILSRIKL
ncbi:MAG: methyl-accepting chemotaxis protein [Nitrospirae bacterium]|nr:methyl-accepting chemotaxis protein [Nitrospirota bacterium]